MRRLLPAVWPRHANRVNHRQPWPRPPLPAFRLSDYRFAQPLGEGSFGKVWLAIKTVAGEPVAIKFLKPIPVEQEVGSPAEVTGENKYAELADREARAMSFFSQTAHHRNVVHAEGNHRFQNQPRRGDREGLGGNLFRHHQGFRH